jgi:hypothetical protein
MMRVHAGLTARSLHGGRERLSRGVGSNFLNLDCASEAAAEHPRFIADNALGLCAASINAQEESHAVFLSREFQTLRKAANGSSV